MFEGTGSQSKTKSQIQYQLVQQKRAASVV